MFQHVDVGIGFSPFVSFSCLRFEDCVGAHRRNTAKEVQLLWRLGGAKPLFLAGLKNSEEGDYAVSPCDAPVMALPKLYQQSRD